LVLGTPQSKHHWIIQQMEVTQDHEGFTTEELLQYKDLIFSNCIRHMKCLIQAGTKLHMGVADQVNEASFQRIGAIYPGREEWSERVAADIKNLWADEGIRNIYALRDLRDIPFIYAPYFFDNIDRFLKVDFIPTQDDTIRARIRPSHTVQEAEVRIEGVLFKFIDIDGLRTERIKWIHFFDSVNVVIFCVAIDQYDQDDGFGNRLKLALLMFDTDVNSHFLKRIPFVLLFTNTDIFKEKIGRVDLTTCWPHYTGGLNFENASSFIKQKFIEQNRSNRNIYTHFACLISTENIEFVFKCIRETVLNPIMEPTQK